MEEDGKPEGVRTGIHPVGAFIIGIPACRDELQPAYPAPSGRLFEIVRGFGMERIDDRKTDKPVSVPPNKFAQVPVPGTERFAVVDAVRMGEKGCKQDGYVDASIVQGSKHVRGAFLA
jgi:hypothetical protein